MNHAHPERILGMYDVSCIWSPLIELMRSAGFAGARTLLPHARGALSIVLILAVSCPELCNLIGVPKFLEGYMQDVHESPDHLSLFCIGGAGA